MSERKEPGLSLSGIDVDNPGVVERPRITAPAPDVKPRGSGLLLTLILLLLAGGIAGLAYWGLGLKQALGEQQTALLETQKRLADMEQMLELTSDSASQAGQTLMGRIGQLETRAGEKYAEFDSEIAKLWTVSYQRNKPQLEEQAKALAAQQEVLTQLEKQVASEGDRLTALDSRLEALSGLGKQLTALDKAVQALDRKLSEQAQALQTVSSDASFALSLEKDERVAADQALDARLEPLLKQAGNSAELAGRVASIERSIQAIDGSRRQFNQSLLQLREQLAQLQRRLGN